ncbi:helix-turn-helix domain-containing protein [Sphaerisporangium album]|uniref:Helix-turn-helix domain-containing protein n=1 Tax=Sphaerisporangium album TaxID=509200 RepID=A0A367EUY2_9ACTN|nr:helix-turn-helix domain-containing protein [Sphaerisporangium album]
MKRNAIPPPETEALLTPGEVAKMFRVDPSTVTRWANAGKLASIRTPGGVRRFYEAEVRALLHGKPSDMHGVEQAATDWPRHSVGVEPVTAELRQADPSVPLAARKAVVERREGRFGKVCTTDLDIADMGLTDLEAAASSYARTYGATYLPAGGAR